MRPIHIACYQTASKRLVIHHLSRNHSREILLKKRRFTRKMWHSWKPIYFGGSLYRTFAQSIVKGKKLYFWKANCFRSCVRNIYIFSVCYIIRRPIDRTSSIKLNMTTFYWRYRYIHVLNNVVYFYFPNKSFFFKFTLHVMLSDFWKSAISIIQLDYTWSIIR